MEFESVQVNLPAGDHRRPEFLALNPAGKIPVLVDDDVMTEEPRIVDVAAQPIAVIHIVVPTAEIRTVMGPGLAELQAAVAAQGIATNGPWFTHHRRRPSDVFDFEIGVPVAKPVAAAGRVQPSQWPAMTVARTVYHGDYEGLGSAWHGFETWIAARGLRPAVDLWERYVVGPESSTDPATWRTELSRPLNP